MDITIGRILGEDDEQLERPENERPVAGAAPVNSPEQAIIGPEDAEIDELANLWQSGNKSEVLHRYFEMDNETSVKLVFVIGLEGALELARAADQLIEQGEAPDGDNAEPKQVHPPVEEKPESLVGEITGRVPEETAAAVAA